MFTFLDRLGNCETLNASPDEPVGMLLMRHQIPPVSVLVLRNGQPVSDTHLIDPLASYVATLIEGYDIACIRDVYSRKPDDAATDAAAYVKRRLSFTKSGSLDIECVALNIAELADHIETTVVETCEEFDLVKEGDRILLGLSGGVDSSSLLLSLTAVCPYLPKFRLAAVTFEDFDSQNSPAFQHAAALAKYLDVEHHIAPADLAREVFHLNTPLREILPSLMNTSLAHYVMYIDHHTTRRTLEVFAEQNGLNCIALGLHTTDLIGGLLNGWMTGYNIANLPVREIGNLRYIYPLAFVSKRELHLYHLHRTGNLAQHSHPNPWERNPTDRIFYYYLADYLQTLWPGLETMLFTAHNQKLRRQPSLRFDRCQNCGAAILQQPFTAAAAGECDVCMALRNAGFIERKVS